MRGAHWSGEPKRVLLVDTSVLLELLQVPFESDRHEEAKSAYDTFSSPAYELRLPMASVLEAGGHIRKISSGDSRRICAQKFEKILRATVAGEAPWSFRDLAWSSDMLQRLLDGTGHDFPMAKSFTDQAFEIGDMAIVEEWRETRSNLSAAHVEVDVWTYDRTLRAVIDHLMSTGTTA